MVVKNLNRTSLSPCRCGDWLKHWHRHGKPSRSFQERQACAVAACTRPIQVGGLVQKEVLEGLQGPGMVGDRTWYVVPLCSECGRSLAERLRLEEDCGLVSANPGETCGGADSEAAPRHSA